MKHKKSIANQTSYCLVDGAKIATFHRGVRVPYVNPMKQKQHPIHMECCLIEIQYNYLPRELSNIFLSNNWLIIASSPIYLVS